MEISDFEKLKVAISNILPELEATNKALEKFGYYYIFYTHPFENGVDKKNILALPSSEKFQATDFYGLVLDLIADYEGENNLKNNKRISTLIGVLEDLYSGKTDLRNFNKK